MIRFMSDTRYAGLEKEMQHIPGFRPRRSGMVISHLSGCLENQRSPCEQHLCKPRVPSDREKKSVLFSKWS